MRVGEGSSEFRRNWRGLRARSYACSSPLELRTQAKAPAGCQRTRQIGFCSREEMVDMYHITSLCVCVCVFDIL